MGPTIAPAEVEEVEEEPPVYFYPRPSRSSSPLAPPPPSDLHIAFLVVVVVAVIELVGCLRPGCGDGGVGQTRLQEFEGLFLKTNQ